MSDTRKWPPPPIEVYVRLADEPELRNALLAVLDECDQIMERVSDQPSAADVGRAHAVNIIRAAIDKTLGVADE